MMKILLVICLLISVNCFAQKDTSEIIETSEIDFINIETDEVYLIKITSTNTSQIKIKTHSEGEYFNQILVKSSISENTLEISTEYPAALAGGFDKLSAHKVFSLEIELEIPKGMQLSVRSNIAALEGHGEFKSLIAELKQGYCKLLDFSGSAVVNTFTGYILVETSSGIIETSSRNGSVEIPDFLPKGKPIKLSSIDGNIMVRKTK